MLNAWKERSNPEYEDDIQDHQLVEAFIENMREDPFANCLIGKINNWQRRHETLGTVILAHSIMINLLERLIAYNISVNYDIYLQSNDYLCRDWVETQR